MKIDITHNSSLELSLMSLNNESLYKALMQSFEEHDFAVIKKQFDRLLTYTGEQLLAFKTEWFEMYRDWYWENCPQD